MTGPVLRQRSFLRDRQRLRFHRLHLAHARDAEKIPQHPAPRPRLKLRLHAARSIFRRGHRQSLANVARSLNIRS